MNRPGARLRAIAAHLFSAATMERLIDPALGDLQAEYEDAKRAGRSWGSRWIRAVSLVAFFRMIALHGAHRAVDLFRGVPGEERRTLVRMSTIALTIVVVVTGVLAAPPLLRDTAISPRGLPPLVVYLIPQALPLSIPIGLTFGIFWTLGRSPASRRLRIFVLLIAAAMSIVSFTILAWVMPAGNQSYRVAIAGRDVARTASELTLGDLGRTLEQRTAAPATFSPAATRGLALHYHTRWALACAPLVLAIVALALTSPRPRGSHVLWLTAAAAIAGYFVILVSARGSALPGSAAAWAPNTFFLILSIAGSRRHQQRAW